MKQTETKKHLQENENIYSEMHLRREQTDIHILCRTYISWSINCLSSVHCLLCVFKFVHLFSVNDFYVAWPDISFINAVKRILLCYFSSALNIHGKTNEVNTFNLIIRIMCSCCMCFPFFLSPLPLKLNTFFFTFAPIRMNSSIIIADVMMHNL